ncbi:MAG TPA: triose-phosphate isomerase [Rhodopila sp.]|uniref:triose-phosphate isomerase n=1 Tax=Rhodopila sp. TaxID=2480087 RepID=UPI002C7EB90A|nr:triose-phosphate isomerase [Rhodopila sp.]HVY17542.1 triose-phosphate isomerase [Rhodopila sp.]
MRQLIAGNWKMHCLMREAVALAEGVAAGAGGIAAELLVCPTALHVAAVAAALKGTPVAVGGQDCHAAKQGAHTGDIAAPMLRDAGATFVILGHSERRHDHHETDAQVRAKTVAAIEAGLTPIVCVGETEAHRSVGEEQSVVAGQLAGSLPTPFPGVVAYEPVWAIGTGKTATEADVEAMHGCIRRELLRLLGAAGAGVRILYGGSVRPANAGSLLALPEVGGALVGGASLKADDFLAIARAAVSG